MRIAALLMLMLLSMLAPKAVASCRFESGYSMSVATVDLPGHLILNIPQDRPGYEIWSSGWRSASSPRITCTGSGVVSGQLAAGIGAAVPGHTSNGFSSVFETNIEGIGIAVFWCNVQSCTPDHTQVTPIPSLDWKVGPYSYHLHPSWWVRLVKTGPIRASGRLQVQGETTIYYQDLAVAQLTIAGGIDINAMGCELDTDSRSITVPLPTVARADFSEGANLVLDAGKSREFRMNLTCDAGVKVGLVVNDTAPSDTPDVLSNASGAGAAEGVGVQLFSGGAGSTQIVPLGRPFDLGRVEGIVGSRPVSHPFVARYYRTAPQVAGIVPGRVSTTAVFMLTYE